MTATTPITVGDRTIGPDHEPFVIAEMSGNHNGDLERALDIVRAASEAGAHAIKIQTYTADTITLDVDSPMFRLSADHPLPPAPWFRPGERRSARRVFVHVLSELAHHTGHADIIRETIDGQKSMG